MKGRSKIKFVVSASVSIFGSMVLLLQLAATGATAAKLLPSRQRDTGATATALIRMQQSIFATQTAIAMTLQPPATATPQPAARTPTPTTVPPTSTAARRPSATPTRTATALPTVQIATPTFTPLPTATVAAPTPAPRLAPMVTVLADGINLRTGPGPGFPVVGGARSGEQFPVLGQVDGCAWFQIKAADGSTLWITGADVYTRLNVACNRLPVAQAPKADEAKPEPSKTSAGAQPAPAAARENTPAPTNTPSQTAPAAASVGPNAIRVLSPAPDVSVSENDTIVFAWDVDAPLEAGQVFELVFFAPGENHAAGRALTNASPQPTVSIRAGGMVQGTYNWGVWLANANPYSRTRYLGDGGVINVTGGGGDNHSDSGAPTRPGDTGEKK